MIRLLQNLGHPISLKAGCGSGHDASHQIAVAQGWAIARAELATRTPGAIKYLDETQKIDTSHMGGSKRGRKVRARRAGRHLPWC
jgi:hypothetical protein